MKKIGLIGGVSWTSAHEYYKRLNEAIYQKLGGFHSAEILLYSFNFEEILQFQASGNSKAEVSLLIKRCKGLEKAGADFVLICSNTTNKTSDVLQKHLKIPVINLIQLTVEEAKKQEYKKLGLLGTKYVMYGDFYKKYFEKENMEIVVPDIKYGMKIHNIIYDELVKGIFNKSSRKFMQKCIQLLAAKGIDAVILGCTEIPLIVNATESKIPLIDTIQIHVDKAIKLALQE